MTAAAEALASRLDRAVRDAVPIPQLSRERALTLDQAYAVQRAGLALRAARGDRRIGVKLGFTSKAKAAQMGVSDVIIGVVTEEMRVRDGGSIDPGRLIHPRVEPEVAYRLGRAVDPTDPDADLVHAVDGVAPALEVIDSRYRDFRFSLEDVVADNTSAAAFVVGPWRPPTVDLADLAVQLAVDGEVVERGSTSAILGHPDRALPAVGRMARRYGLTLPVGTVVLAGAATAAVPLPGGARVEATVAGLGSVSLTTRAASAG